MTALTLEVRAGNTAAQGLYRRFGLAPAGVRRAYYQPDGEDALVMWAHEIDAAAVRGAFGPASRHPGGVVGDGTRPGGPSVTDIPDPTPTTVLGIETSCDETAAAVVCDGERVLSSVVSSQVDLHARYGGVVPEIASRAHVELLIPVVAQAVVEAGLTDGDVEAVGATYGPGLVGSLLVGVSAAKTLALAWDVPFVAVNHLEAHLYAALLEEPDLELPVVVLLVSGGHTMLVRMDGHGRYQVLGATVDDAAGEAFDKVARFLGLGYPGGPAIDAVAMEGDPEAIAFPRAMKRRRARLLASAGSRPRSSTTSASTPTSATAGRGRLVPGGGRRRPGRQGARRRPGRRGQGHLPGRRGGGQQRAARARARRVRRGRDPGTASRPVDVHRQRRHGRRCGLAPTPRGRPVAPRHRSGSRTRAAHKPRPWGSTLASRVLALALGRGECQSRPAPSPRLTPSRRVRGAAISSSVSRTSIECAGRRG